MNSGASTTGRPGAAPQGHPGEPVPPSGARRLRPVLAGLVAVLLVAGTVAALTGVGDSPAAPVTSVPPPTVAPPDTFAVTPPDGWTSVSAPAGPLDVFGVPFTRLAEVPPFAAGECPADPAPRGVAAAALVAVPAGTSIEEAARAFARGAGESAYAGAAPQVAVGPAGPRPGPDDAEDGIWVEATVRTDGTAAGRPGCRATDGAVGVLAVPRAQARDGSTGVAMLVVVTDIGGGPGAPVSRDAPAELASSAVRPG
ncbi:hypothetical protein [Pseudonocardia sp. NPDC049635]|uniref:hypothetical protein n=1 Tax=Pseudonocardia sp. NPDC049635 TaxID=3155506 RepID=UPI0033E760BF